MPKACVDAAIRPVLRPPLSVCCNTTASDGPGDIAAKRQIETTDSQIVTFIVLQFDALLFWMHPAGTQAVTGKDA